jgi:MFS family permease
MKLAQARAKAAYGLPADVWIVQLGVFLNHFGWAAIFPFELIYLHNARGFGFGISGLIVGTLTGAAVIAAPVVGVVIDRFGARTTAAVSCVTLAAGYAGLAFSVSPWAAFGSATLAGLGNGGLFPSQYTLVASLAAPEVRHRATAVMRIASNSATAIGAPAGGLLAMRGLNGFVVLLVLNAVTYLLYGLIILGAIRENARPEPIPRGYRVMLRDRPFIRLVGLNIAVTAVGWGVFNWILPTYTHDAIGASTAFVGLLVTANACTVVLVQLPIARYAEGRRRTAALSLGALAFCTACLLAAGAADIGLGYAYTALVLAAVIIAIGECAYMTALIPLAADLAPAALRGRYMATIQFTWWLGMALAPTVGGALLGVSGVGTMLLGATIGAFAAIGMARLDPSLPDNARRTPRRVRSPATGAAEAV